MKSKFVVKFLLAGKVLHEISGPLEVDTDRADSATIAAGVIEAEHVLESLTGLRVHIETVPVR